MIGITSYKVSIPTALFLLLSYTGLNKKTTMYTTLANALVFCIVYSIIAHFMGMVLTYTDLLVTTFLFIALNPGVLLTIPPGPRGVFMSGESTTDALVVHTALYAVLFALLRKNFPQYY